MHHRTHLDVLHPSMTIVTVGLFYLVFRPILGGLVSSDLPRMRSNKVTVE